MADKMLIDATHPEETRVVVLRGNRVEEFDFESANRKQLRGNIYLAKVTRVEPSLQAAFVDYGGNRHGFLAFSEIHPDYYQIPVADRQALLAEEARAERDADEEAESRSNRRGRRHRGRSANRRRDSKRSEPVAPEEAAPADLAAGDHLAGEPEAEQAAVIAPEVPEMAHDLSPPAAEEAAGTEPVRSPIAENMDIAASSADEPTSPEAEPFSGDAPVEAAT
jgi:ribonuclease E